MYFFIIQLFFSLLIGIIPVPDPLPAPVITMVLSFFKSKRAPRSSRVKLLYLSFGISMLINCSSRLLQQTSIVAYKVDFGLNLSGLNSFYHFGKIGAITQSCSVKKVFLEISQNL